MQDIVPEENNVTSVKTSKTDEEVSGHIRCLFGHAAVSCQSGQVMVCGNTQSEVSPTIQVEKMLAQGKSPGATKARSPRKPRTSRAEQMVNRMSLASIISYPPHADSIVNFPSHAPETSLVAV